MNQSRRVSYVFLSANHVLINDFSATGLRALHYAAYQNYMECVNLLLVRGADVDAVDDIGYTAMHLCAERGYLDLILLLLQHGARVKFTEEKRGSVVSGTQVITSEIKIASPLFPRIWKLRAAHLATLLEQRSQMSRSG